MHSFLTRRFGAAAAENLGSAVIHGIYAGDSRELSIQAVFPSLVELEREHGALSRALLPRWLNSRYAWEYHKLPQRMPITKEFTEHAKGISIYSFPDGLGEIVKRIEAELIASPNVQIWKGTECESISYEDGKFVLGLNDSVALHADRLVAALPARVLAQLLPTLPHLAHNPSAHIGIVDIVLAPREGTPKLPIDGFGYLVPRSADNPDDILGVILDSSAVPNQGSSNFFKLTAMIGGPYWRGCTTFPSKEDLEARALRALEHQLGIPKPQLEEQVRMVRTRVLLDTIPQYLVGHCERIHELQDAVKEHFSGLSLIGSSYSGVGVNDCVTSALDTCEAIALAEKGKPHRGTTGLEDI